VRDTSTPFSVIAVHFRPGGGESAFRRDAFGSCFRNEVGLSPKAFCRIRRFNEVLRHIERLATIDWLDVALSCGYFDQAHFNHDFRAFAGLSPSAYLRDRMSRTHVAVSDE
jgi:AraC-like DNA-binding protein